MACRTERRLLAQWRSSGRSNENAVGARRGLPVRRRASCSPFFIGDDSTVVQSYAFAKAVIASWLAKVASRSLYPRLERLKDGQFLRGDIYAIGATRSRRQRHRL
jgi:hypothetical protein